ncbi:hypothetical protein FOVSG1_002960 [Fusarium oxysporum f. sp. vasinfectum]
MIGIQLRMSKSTLQHECHEIIATFTTKLHPASTRYTRLAIPPRQFRMSVKGHWLTTEYIVQQLMLGLCGNNRTQTTGFRLPTLEHNQRPLTLRPSLINKPLFGQKKT